MTIIIDLGSSAVKAGFALEDGRYGDLHCNYISLVRSFGRSVVSSLGRSVVQSFVCYLFNFVLFN